MDLSSVSSVRLLSCQSEFRITFSFGMNGKDFLHLVANVSNSTVAESSSLGIEVDWLILINLLFAAAN